MTNPDWINPETGENFDPYEGWENPPKEDALEDMSVKDLKAEAKALGLSGFSKLKALELVDLIREAREEIEFEVVEAGEGPEEVAEGE